MLGSVEAHGGRSYLVKCACSSIFPPATRTLAFFLESVAGCYMQVRHTCIGQHSTTPKLNAENVDVKALAES